VIVPIVQQRLMYRQVEQMLHAICLKIFASASYARACARHA